MKNILVYGDLMIDRTWIVEGRVEPSVQAHAKVIPMRRVDSSRQSDRFGGAGMTASAMVNFCEDVASVHLLCWSDCSDVEKIKDKVYLDYLSSEKKPVTTIKFRVYDIGKKGLPELKFRFDQDAPKPELPLSLPPDLPKPDFIVISDFNKGAVQINILKALLTKYPAASWFIDTKNHQLFNDFPELKATGGTIFANREEAFRLWQTLNPFNSRETLDISSDLKYCRSDLLHIGKAIRETLTKWTLVIKLDRDGAVVFCDKGYAECCPNPVKATGIAAGDVFLAAWFKEISFPNNNGKADKLTPEELALARATMIARDWVEKSTSTKLWEDSWYAGREEPCLADLGPIKPFIPDDSIKFTPIEQNIQNELKKTKFPNCLIQVQLKPKEIYKLDLRDANFGFGKFLSVSPDRRRSIIDFKNKIEDYINQPFTTRPLNCLLAGDPGTGKSFFVRQLAESLYIPFHELNVAHFATHSDCLPELSRIASGVANKREKTFLLMIDEVDTKHSEEVIYPLLLDPLWNGVIMDNGIEYNLGKHFVTILVVSSVKSIKEFERILKKSPKGPDLLSRLNGPRIHLTAPNAAKFDADYAYLIGSIIRNYFPDIRFIFRGFFDVMYNRKLSPRHLEYLLLKMKVKTDGTVRIRDVEHLLRENERSAMTDETLVQVIDDN